MKLFGLMIMELEVEKNGQQNTKIFYGMQLIHLTILLDMKI